MPRHVYGPQELQARLNVGRTRMRQIISRPDFPAPFDQVAMGSLWLISDVEEWIKEHRPHLAED
jgi:prophage regulatory protein